MDRDAPAPPRDEVVPPVCWGLARRTILVGGGLIGVAAGLGLADAAPGPVSTARLFLVFIGAVAAGLGVSFRPDRWEAWALGSAAAALGVAGLPAHWDSFRFLFGVLAGVGVFRLVVGVVPPAWRLGLVSAFILFHFAGIFMATASPPPSPWLVEQVYHRVYNQYLQFIYMRNAYHFYSPEPGPASLMACLVKTEVGTETTADGRARKKYETRWVVLPKRPADVRDPLGLSYFRRLSLSDQISRGMPDFSTASFEKTEVRARRFQLTIPGSETYYPLHPNEPEVVQYRLPTPEVARFLLPSYAQYLILEHTPDADAAARTTLRIYRLEHRTLTAEALVGVANPGGRPGEPYHPVTYRPYYLGEFRLTSEDAAHPGRPRVELVDPQDPMLYWLVPVLPAAGPGDGKKNYTDYLSTHAGHEFDWRQLR